MPWILATAIALGITGVKRFYLYRWRAYTNKGIAWQMIAAGYMHSTLQSLCEFTWKGFILRWSDDILSNTKSFWKLLDTLKTFFKNFRDQSLKLNSRKCERNLTEVRRCGRIINSDGVKRDPRRLEDLLAIKEPTTGSELLQFICVENWIRKTIPTFGKLVPPLKTYF